MPRVDAKEALIVLLELTQALTSERPIEDSLTAVTEAALRLVGADHASVRLLDASRTTLLSSARSGTGSGDQPVSFKRGEGAIGWAVERGASLRIDDVSADPRFTRADAQGFTVGSILCEPLWSSGEVMGAITVSSPEVGAFDDEAQMLVRLLANCSSPPIERARLLRLAMFDSITMAMSHRYLFPRLGEELERADRVHAEVSLLLMDLDHFKQVNDAHGHAVGDAMLRAFADRVRGLVRRIDVLVRRGGDEFVLIMPLTGSPQAFATAKRIQESLERKPLDAGSVVRRLTVSIGVATWDVHETPEALERRADAAMYRAKDLGRNRVVVAA